MFRKGRAAEEQSAAQPFHLAKARENGLTETELVEAITHLAFYCGWPRAMSAIMIAKQLFNMQ